jgi:glutamine---fructose-6-phosphate transaminase (isomerizing)
MTTRMIEEIREQPEVLGRVLEDGWGEIRTAARTTRSRGFRFAMLAARGTSDNAAYYAKYLFENLLGIPTALASPSSFTIYGAEMDLRDVLVVGVSQSGESADVLETVRRSRGFGAAALSITNDENSSLAGAADFHFPLRAGGEKSVAATKTYTAELLLLYLLTHALGGAERPDDATLRLPEQGREVLEVEWRGAARYRYADHMVVASRGYNLATAREAALKLMETTYMVAEAFSAADLRHGPIAMIGHDFPVLAVVPPGETCAGMVELVDGLAERGAELVVIGANPDVVARAAAGFVIPTSCPEPLSPILHVLPAQLLAHDLALLKGLNPDAPRGLSKVTETW